LLQYILQAFRRYIHRDAYKCALRAIDCAVSAQNKTPFFFDVVTCVNRRNIASLEKIRDLLVTKGVRHWRLVTIFPKGRATAHTELALSCTELHSLMQFIKKIRSDGTIGVSYGCEGFLGSYEMEVRDTPFYCRAGVNIGSVLIDGSISACPSLRNDFIQGNNYKERFSDVWEKKFKVMRNRSWALKGECKKCSVWRHCQGNSLHLRSESTGELLHCFYNKLQEHEASQ
jgi:radical SAM protein with 4Fe4S-binding SPASM domain